MESSQHHQFWSYKEVQGSKDPSSHPIQGELDRNGVVHIHQHPLGIEQAMTIMPTCLCTSSMVPSLGRGSKLLLRSRNTIILWRKNYYSHWSPLPRLPKQVQNFSQLYLCSSLWWQAWLFVPSQTLPWSLHSWRILACMTMSSIGASREVPRMMAVLVPVARMEVQVGERLSRMTKITVQATGCKHKIIPTISCCYWLMSGSIGTLVRRSKQPRA